MAKNITFKLGSSLEGGTFRVLNSKWEVKNFIMENLGDSKKKMEIVVAMQPEIKTKTFLALFWVGHNFLVPGIVSCLPKQLEIT